MKSTVRLKCDVCGKVFDGDMLKAFERHKTTCVPKDNADILHDAIETLELTIRSARRCAYDLRHCADSLSLHRPRSASDSEMAKLFSERADFFVKLFQSGQAMKDYRHRLYHQIEELEHRVKNYQAILAEHKIDDPTLF